LRPGNAGNNRYAPPLMVRLVCKLKARFPNARILIRADAGFCVPRFLDAIERLDRQPTHVRYVIGLQQNCRLGGLAHAPMQDAAREATRHGPDHASVRHLPVCLAKLDARAVHRGEG